MKEVLIDDKIISVDFFENISNKEYPYFQDGNKYAICPYCMSSVQIIGGDNNSTQSKQKNIYAAHTKNKISGLMFNEKLKNTCVCYEGNRNNWQQIYTKNSSSKKENLILKKYIEDNKDKIKKEISEIIGFNCSDKFFNKFYESFIKNKGLYEQNFVPSYVSRKIVYLSEPIGCWGFIVKDSIKNKIIKEREFSTAFEKNQFKPELETQLVGVLDNDVMPKKILVKLLYNNKELIINKVSAEVK